MNKTNKQTRNPKNPPLLSSTSQEYMGKVLHWQLYMNELYLSQDIPYPEWSKGEAKGGFRRVYTEDVLIFLLLFLIHFLTHYWSGRKARWALVLKSTSAFIFLRHEKIKNYTH